MTEKISSKYYLLSVFIPILCIILVLGYAVNYMEDEINFVEHEIVGLNKVNEIHNTTVYLQKLRGISSMTLPSEKYNLIKEKYITNTKKHLNSIEKDLRSNEIMYLPSHAISAFISSVINLFEIQDKYSKSEVFSNYSRINEYSSVVQKKIALNSNLKLDNVQQSHILIETIVLQLPELIEYTGQLRALMVSKSGEKISNKIFIDLSNRISVINELSNALDFNMYSILDLDVNNKSDLINEYSKTIDSRNRLVNYIYLNFEKKLKLKKSEEIYEFFTNNMNSMIELYNLNSKILNNLLNTRLNKKNIIKNYMYVFGLLCIFFIIYNFINYYKKNGELINSMNKSNIQLKEQSITDSLTKLYNRRHFDVMFEQQFKQSNRDNTSFVFMMCDIDYFKKYNDNYGHLNGDDTLIKVSECIRKSLNRPNDFVFRLGGEEFGIIISNANFENVKSFANRIKNNIEKLDIEHIYNDNVDYLTISMGVVYLENNKFFSINEIYNYADRAMYQSKDSGRNQITFSQLK